MKTNPRILTATLLLSCLVICPGQSSFQLSTNVYSAAENAGGLTFVVRRLSDTNTAVSVDFSTANGSATAGLDYVATNGTLVFASGQIIQSITVPILNDGLAEAASETFSIALSNPGAGAALATPYQALAQITDNDAGLQFEFGPATFFSYRVGEGEGLILLGVARCDDGEFPVSVDFRTSDATAIQSLDYLATNGTLTFGPGQKVALLTVPILNDGLKEASETFQVTLSNPTNQVLGSQKLATVTIVDNDGGVQFQPYNLYRVAENEAFKTLTVARGNDGNLGSFTVNYATSDLTATAGLDYVATNGTLSFAQDEMVKTVAVPILYDELKEVDEQFRITLSNPTGGGVLGPNAVGTITILDITNTPLHRCETITLRPDRTLQLSASGSVDGHFREYFDLFPIEVSSGLADWTPRLTLLRTNALNNAVSFIDTQATNWDRRFYRTASQHLVTPWVKPTGPFTPGVVSRLITDPSRRNRHGVSTNSSFMISVWYPAVPESGRLPGPIVDLAIAQDPNWMTAVGLTDFTARMAYLKSHALPDVPCATNVAPCPVVLYSPGHAVPRALCAELGPNLASHGFVVVSVDHYDAVRTVFPDGTYFQPFTSDVTARLNAAAGTADRVRDLVFILDELTRWNATDSVFAGRLDLARVAAVGGSWGGTTVAEFSRVDGRCHAVVGLEPGGFSSAPQLVHIENPLLQINASGHGDTTLFTMATTNAIYFQITGTDHLLVAGGDWYWAWHPENVAGGREAARTVNAFVLWFLDKYLNGSLAPKLSLADYPRVTGYAEK